MDEDRRTQAQSCKAGRNKIQSGKGSPRRASPDCSRSRDGLIYESDIRVVGHVPRRRLGCPSSQEGYGSAETAFRQADSVDLQYGNHEEPASIETSFRSVDAFPNQGRYLSKVQDPVEPNLDWKTAGSVRTYLPEAALSCLPAESVIGRAMAEKRVSANSGNG